MEWVRVKTPTKLFGFGCVLTWNDEYIVIFGAADYFKSYVIYVSCIN